jgi:hypothetical protein
VTEHRVAPATHPPAAPTAASASPDGAEATLLRALADRVDARDPALSDAEVSGALRRAADEVDRAHQRAEAALASALRWKERAVASWADGSRGAAADRAELVDLRTHAHELATELEALQQTLSWRLTAPLRGVRRLRPGRDR